MEITARRGRGNGSPLLIASQTLSTRLRDVGLDLGSIGLISPLSNHFCSNCNRLRLTADGHLKPCLHSREEICIKGMNEEQMAEAIRQAALLKPRQHDPLSPSERSHAARPMNQIGG